MYILIATFCSFENFNFMKNLTFLKEKIKRKVTRNNYFNKTKVFEV